MSACALEGELIRHFWHLAQKSTVSSECEWRKIKIHQVLNHTFFVLNLFFNFREELLPWSKRYTDMYHFLHFSARLWYNYDADPNNPIENTHQRFIQPWVSPWLDKSISTDNMFALKEETWCGLKSYNLSEIINHQIKKLLFDCKVRLMQNLWLNLISRCLKGSCL